MNKNLTDFFTAIKRLNSKNQEYKKQLVKTLTQQAGIQEGTVVDAVHDTPIVSQPTTAQALYHNAGEEAKMHYLASWVGLTMRHNSMLVFHARSDGPDSLYKIKAQAEDPQTIRDALDSVGILQRIILPSQEEANTYSVLIHDKDKQRREQVISLSKTLKGEVHETAGEGHFIGDSKFPNKARQQYREIINNYEQGISN